jgi:hypothetical protein
VEHVLREEEDRRYRNVSYIYLTAIPQWRSQGLNRSGLDF